MTDTSDMPSTVAFAGEWRLMARVERWLGQRFIRVIALSALVTAAFIVIPFIVSRTEAPIDWLAISAIPAILGAFAMAMSIPWRSERVLAQLANRRVLQLPAEKLDGLKREVSGRAARAARWGSLVGTVLILPVVAMFITGTTPVLVRQIQTNDSLGVALTLGFAVLDIPATLLCGVLGGYYGGYAISVGRWASQLRSHGVTLRTRPGHPDGAAGWGPLGELYLFQALMLMIPTLYYGVWWYLITANVDGAYARYHTLQTPYVVFFLVILATEVLAFILPIWSFHEDMRLQKEVLASETDALSDHLLTVQARAVETDNAEEASNLSRQLATMTSLYEARADMPTWPLRTNLALRFLLANLGLLVPLVAQFLPFRL